MSNTDDDVLRIKFWPWLRKDGLRLFAKSKPMAVTQLVVALLLMLVSPMSLEEDASVILFPLAGVLVGLSFAWVGNAQVLLQSDEFSLVMSHGKRSKYEHVHMYTLSVLVLIVTIVGWCLAGLGIFDRVWPICRSSWLYNLVTFCLFLGAVVSIRECWHVVYTSQTILIAKMRVRDVRVQEELDENADEGVGR